MIKKYKQLVLSGKQLNFEQAVELANTKAPAELYQAADELRSKLHSNHFDLCSIVNAKSGKCSENCKFCAQSSHHDTEVETYDVVDQVTALTLAKESEKQGVKRFSLVTAGSSVSKEQLDELGKIYGRLQEETRLSFCASMGSGPFGQESV